MTVKELKELLETVPDDVEITGFADDEGRKWPTKKVSVVKESHDDMKGRRYLNFKFG